MTIRYRVPQSRGHRDSQLKWFIVSRVRWWGGGLVFSTEPANKVASSVNIVTKRSTDCGYFFGVVISADDFFR